MADIVKIKELLQTSTGTEGSLLIPKKIYDRMIMAVDKALIPRSEAMLVLGPADIPGSSIDLNLETADSMKVTEVGEGAEFPLDVEEYTSINLKPKKYGVAVRITREMIEDSKFNLLGLNIDRAGKEMAENENSLVISDALDNAANTVSGGASFTIANLTRAMQYLEDSDYTPTTFFVGNEVLNDLRNIDTFVEYNKIGNTDMIAKGFQGTLYGLNVIRVSTNAGMTTTSAYVTDKSNAYVIAEKRALTVEGFNLPTFDMEGAVISQRLKVRYVRASAIAKITSS
jgi:HK97 family phage major capsid protein